MLKKVYSPRGLNLRDSDINRSPEYSSDLKNVEKNSKGEVRQRWGIDEIAITWQDKAGGAIGAKTILDLFEYIGDGSSRELLALVTDGLYRLEGTVFKEIPNMTSVTPAWTKPTKTVEYNRVLYWNDPDDSKEFADIEHLWKYDGCRISRAGAPKPKVTVNSVAAGAGFYRVIMRTRDVQGNITWSEFESIGGLSSGGDWNILSIMDTYYEGFIQRFGMVDGAQTINAANLTLDVDTVTHGGAPNHNFVAGDMILALKDTGDTIPTYGGSPFKITRYECLEVESVTNSVITFTAASVGTFDWLFADDDPLDVTYDISFYFSTDEFFNYTKGAHFPLFPTLDESAVVRTVGTPIAGSEVLTEVYDDSFIRSLPPKAKYFTTFGNHMVCGGLLSGRDSEGNIINALATSLDNTRITDNIQWSDFPTFSNGSTIETFNPDYVQGVGISEDGPIVAIHGNDDSLAVHKEEQSYYVYGDFITATLRIRKTQTSEIGAASHRSIEEVNGGHIYMSPKGVFGSTGGQPPKELSDIIEPLFRDNGVSTQLYNLKEANSINDFYREKIYIFLPYSAGSGGDTLVFDYYYKEWFLHDSLDASGGFISINEDIYLTDGTSLWVRNLNSTKDAGKKIKSYYITGWFDLDAPTLRKKWVRLLLLSLGATNWTPTITPQCNWVDSDLEEFTLLIDDDVKVDDAPFPNIQSHSMRFKVASNEKNEGFLMTGYEVEFELTQTKPKGMR